MLKENACCRWPGQAVSSIRARRGGHLATIHVGVGSAAPSSDDNTGGFSHCAATSDTMPRHQFVDGRQCGQYWM